MEPAKDREPGGQSGRRPDQPRHLRPADHDTHPRQSAVAEGRGDAGKIVDALKSSAEQEMTIAERLAGKARRALRLGRAFLSWLRPSRLAISTRKDLLRASTWILAILAVLVLGLAAAAMLKADSPVASGDLPLTDLRVEPERSLRGRPGCHWASGWLLSRGSPNPTRRKYHTTLLSYKWARRAVMLSLVATTAELIFALIARAT